MSPEDGTVVPRAIFVDPSGRRSRVVRRTSVVLGALASAYVVLVLLALVVPAGLGRLTVPGLGPLLPGPAAPSLVDTAGAAQLPSQVLVAQSPQKSSSAAKATTGTATKVTPAAPSGTSATGSTAVTAQPSPSAAAPGKSALAPGQAATSPSSRSTNAAIPHPAKT
jgi:hypothetical protein